MKIKKETLNILIVQIVGYYIFYNFKSIKRCAVFLFHKYNLLDLKEIKSTLCTWEYLCLIIDDEFNVKIKKQELRELVGLSNVTFNSYFKDFYEEQNLKGRKSFTILEAYKIISYWQGEGGWLRPKAFTKNELIEIFTNGSYKKLKNEFDLSFDNFDYKGKDKISPRVLKEFISHIDFNEKEIIAEKFM